MTTILAIANQKGGVGKTTTAINLGAGLGALERRVLLVDCDPQGNATRGLGANAEVPHLYHALTGEVPLPETVHPSGFPNLDLIGAQRDLVGVEVEFVGEEGWEGRLKAILKALSERYDYILLDCPPSLGHLTVCALSAADAVLVPLQCEYFALEGISHLMATVKRMQGGLKPGWTSTASCSPCTTSARTCARMWRTRPGALRRQGVRDRDPAQHPARRGPEPRSSPSSSTTSSRRRRRLPGARPRGDPARPDRALE